MLAILKVVFKKEDDLREGTDCYIDDILVDETAEPASKFVSHLDKFGLTVKAAGITRKRSSIGSSA